MLIGKPFRYLFLVIYQWTERHTKSGQVLPTTVAGVAFFLGLNVFVGLELMLLFHTDNFATNLLKLNARLMAIAIFGSICYIIWLLFVANGSYKNFGREFETTADLRLLVRRIIVSSYLVLTVCLPFFTKALIQGMHHAT